MPWATSSGRPNRFRGTPESAAEARHALFTKSCTSFSLRTSAERYSASAPSKGPLFHVEQASLPVR